MKIVILVSAVALATGGAAMAGDTAAAGKKSGDARSSTHMYQTKVASAAGVQIIRREDTGKNTKMSKVTGPGGR